ncbi:MAG TPA: DMT family transporter [Thermoplasmata archaeon]|nr:DMT family transporter [Thermoplasmata archaeon]
MAAGLTRFYRYVLLGSALSGTSFPATKFLLTFLDPFSLGFIRVGIAAVLATPLLFLRRSGVLEVFLDGGVWLVACLSAVSITLLHVAITMTTASKASLIVNANLVFIALFSVWLLKERLTGRQIGGIGIALAGVGLLAAGSDPQAALRPGAIGDALALSSAALSGLTVVLTKRLLDRHDYVRLAVAVLLIASVALVVPMFAFGGPIALPLVGWTVLLWVAGISTFLATLMWTFGLGKVGATVSSLLFAVQVVVAAGLSVLLLSEPITLAFLVGSVLILGAVRLTAKGP